MNDMRLNLAVKSLQDASLVEADGDLGPWTMEAFGEAIRRAADGGSCAVVLDLSRVKSIDISALSVLKNACVMLGPDRKLCAVARGHTRRIMEITRFDAVVGVFARLEDALEAAGCEAGAAG